MKDRKATHTTRLIKWLAREFDVALAEDAPGAVNATPPAPTRATGPDDPEVMAARERFETWKEIDPFPKIAPSLLNSADIDDYMRVAAVVHPYDPSKRKTASYPLSVGNEIAFWDASRPQDRPIRELAAGGEVVIPPNSLIYVRTAEQFQLPNYMAVRFNLHIDLVHKGLLLGTGPLVDPGFSGRLMVPLHNLTSNTYMLQVGDDFIWAEFTKTSMVNDWTKEGPARPERTGALVDFPKRKVDRSMADYVYSAQKAHPVLQRGLSHAGLQNAIPDAIERARDKAAEAKRSAGKAKRKVTVLTGFGILGILGAFGTLVGQLMTTRSSLQTTLGLVGTTNTRLEDQARRAQELDWRLRTLDARLQDHLRRERPAISNQSQKAAGGRPETSSTQ